MTILLILVAIVGVYLGVAFGVYKWMMGSNHNTTQKSMSGFVVLMALAWPLGLVLWAMSEGDKEHDKEQRP